MRAAFHTLGCKVNQYETEALKEAFLARGWEIVDAGEAADVYIINTCTVTALADRKSRQFIRRAKKRCPGSVVAVTGCYVQSVPRQAAALAEADLLVGVADKMRLPEYVEEFLRCRRRFVRVRPLKEETSYAECGSITSMDSRTRACLKIEEGCDRRCSYCVIPYVRGAVRSRAPEAVLDEARQLLAAGFRELVLTGINTALYDDLPGLLARLDRLDGDFRVRLSSLEPTVVNVDRVTELLSAKRLCHHLHLSLQSGSDRILRAMNRPYTADDFFRIVEALRRFDPSYGITTDLIVGFPGETEADFAATLAAVRRARFARVHVFRYSPRPHTAAAELPGQIPPQVKKERAQRLAAAARETADAFADSCRGQEERVLFESAAGAEQQQAAADGLRSGYSGSYLRVYAPAAEAPADRFRRVRLGPRYRDGVRGEVLGNGKEEKRR
jgi:threonylcarbamoyladenosine tRNA methylthiotransferase MtaB